MTPAEITALVSSIGGLIAGIGTPVYLSRRKANHLSDSARLLDSRAVAEMLKEERDALRQQLVEMQDRHERQIELLKEESQQALARAESKWRAQHEQDQQVIGQLRNEVDGLYRRLFGQPQQPGP